MAFLKVNDIIFSCLGAILFVMHNPPVMLDAEVGPNLIRGDQLTRFLKAQVTLVSEKTRIPNNNNNSLHIVGSVKLYIHVGRLTELLTSLACE